jgi:hypothetical protein
MIMDTDGGTLLGVAAMLLVAGLATGVLAGLFGVGGGAILVPVLFLSFTLVGVEEAVAMELEVEEIVDRKVIFFLSIERIFKKVHRRDSRSFRSTDYGAGRIFAGNKEGNIEKDWEHKSEFNETDQRPFPREVRAVHWRVGKSRE